jgi:hypothetical protein
MMENPSWLSGEFRQVRVGEKTGRGWVKFLSGDQAAMRSQ